VKLNDPSQPGGGYDFGNLLVGDISRVEVLRGAQSTLWGSQAIGGVVNIVTAAPTKPFESSLDAEGGSLSTVYVRAGVGGASGRFTWRVAASHYRTGGVSAYRLGKEPDGNRNTGLSGRLNAKLSGDLSLDLRAVYYNSRSEFDGFPPPAFSFADDPEYGRNKTFVGYGGLNFAALAGRLQNRLAVGYTRTDRVNFDLPQAPSRVTFDGLGQNRRYEYQGALDIAQGWFATFGAEREDAHSVTVSTFSPKAHAKATTDSLYAQVQGEAATGLTLTGGVRHDDHDTFGGKTLGQVAAAWSLNQGATVLRASFGQGFKAPTLYQLFSEYGNTTLLPEQADGWDAGVEQSLLDRNVKLSATWFSRKTKNQIDFVSCFGGPAPLCPTHPSGGYYDNIARTKAHGIELQGLAKLGPVSLNANYTWTKAQNDVAGSANFDRLLARRPEHQANVSADWTWLEKLTTGVSLRYVGASFDNPANTILVKGRTLVDVRASYPLTDNLEVYGRVENLTDRSYETLHDYGAAGRAAYAGVRARF
jgi:vitamin B12 transporter